MSEVLVYLEEGTVRLPATYEIRDGSLVIGASGRLPFEASLPAEAPVEVFGTDGLRFGSRVMCSLKKGRVPVGTVLILTVIVDGGSFRSTPVVPPRFDAGPQQDHHGDREPEPFPHGVDGT